ncbi:hypothetical protein N4T77_00035 [Clostridium sp. CX1]|uniref:hypothetical protein n=1 Tax=Clostridium sp. CX1 TaxID=2978346 RepID=UPI0021BF5637|nr:hypothetical protein [Clostridium sp. CX1]MCT8974976.1 hypothetical protein [Clostridium sp. CX1]
MRLFKFLVISNEVINKSKMIKPVVRVKIQNKNNGLNNVKLLSTKSDFYFLCEDLEKIQENILSQYNILDSKKGIVLMSIDYPNEGINFCEENRAYVVIDANDVDKVMDLISPSKNTNTDTKFQGDYLNDHANCTACSKLCYKNNLCISLDNKHVRGTTWSFTNDTAGTRNKEFYEEIDGVTFKRRLEPKTGGIVYTSLQWESGKRPANLDEKTIHVPLHHWVKCQSIPKEAKSITDYSFYHIGHTFDYRNSFIGLATLNDQEDLRKKQEPDNNIRRGARVLAGHKFLSNDLECKQGCLNVNNSECKNCEGVLYINTTEGLVNLYNQLMSEEYAKLSEGKII